MSKHGRPDQAHHGRTDFKKTRLVQVGGKMVAELGNDHLGIWLKTSVPQSFHARAIPAWQRGWRNQLRFLLDTFGHQGAVGIRQVGNRTFATRAQSITASLEKLRTGNGNPALALPLENLLNFRQKHVQRLASFWAEEGLSPKTQARQLSDLRQFCRWIGKRDLIPPVPSLQDIDLIPSQFETSSVAQRDRSAEASIEELARRLIDGNPDWEDFTSLKVDCTPSVPEPVSPVEHTENSHQARNPVADVTWPPDLLRELEKLFAQAKMLNPRLELILRMQLAFGLRFMEALQWTPHQCIRAETILVDAGTKGGRPREVPILNDYQRWLLDQCCAVKLGDSLSGKNKSLAKTERHFRYLLEKLGLTGNGLYGMTSHAFRHSYLHSRYQQISGVPVPVKCPDAVGDPELIRKAQQTVATEAGHARRTIHTAYTGSARPKNFTGADGKEDDDDFIF